jgi:hypothetical protein
MRQRTGNEIRELFLRLFESKGHRRVHSSSPVPAGFSTGVIYKIPRQWDVPEESLAELEDIENGEPSSGLESDPGPD